MASFLSTSPPASSFLSSSNPAAAFRGGKGGMSSPRTARPGAAPRGGATAFHTGGQLAAAAATLYQVLDIPETATAADVKAAYRRLARRCHPDAVPGPDKAATTEAFVRIHAAYSLLSDARARADYDRSLRRPIPPSFRSYSSSSSATPRGRSWESDQCWC